MTPVVLGPAPCHSCSRPLYIYNLKEGWRERDGRRHKCSRLHKIEQRRWLSKSGLRWLRGAVR